MATKASVAANDPAPAGPDANFKIYDIDNRLSYELVVAFVGPVGAGVTTTCNALSEKIQRKFGYDPVYIKLSEIIETQASKVGEIILPSDTRSNRIDKLQSAGNALRVKYGEAYLADRAIEQIAFERQERGGYLEVNGRRVVDAQRRAYFLDSIKNPAELKRLRQVYGDLLWVVSVFAPDNVRLSRLISSGFSDEDARHAMNRDYEEEEKSGQKVSKVAHQANYFIRNSSDLKDNLDYPLDRFLASVFGTKLHTPTQDEKGMMEAASAAVRSACLSRQVGAAIYNYEHDLIGVGCNDVPKFNGGLYTDGPSDNRCYHWKDKECHNDKKKIALAQKVATTFGDKSEQNFESLEKVMDLGVGNLIEFSRSVHAEMEAIVSVARAGSGSTLGSTLYTTTFPCHNCARHIVAAGVTTVYYVEPYSKSLALELHSDSISLDEDCDDKVRFLQYQGFSPRTSLKLFSSIDRTRKDQGKFVEVKPESARPLFAPSLDSYTTSENLIIQRLHPDGGGNGEQ